MEEIGLAVPRSGLAYTLDEAMAVAERGRLPADRAGRRSSSAAAAPASPHDADELRARRRRTGSPPARCRRSCSSSRSLGWKEYELEVMRDHADNVVVICSIENFDAMGVHTGDSITVAPAQTLTDVEYQRMRDAAFACIRRIGVDTGGSNIQFAVEPGERRHGRHRDEPARVALERAGEQGHRASRSPRSRRASRWGTGSTRS